MAPLVRIAERDNPKRSFLLVSTVLGKHLPVDGVICRLAGLALAQQVAGDPRAARTEAALHGRDDAGGVSALDSRPARLAPDTIVVGFAETATGLAEQVAAGLDAAWFQTTTRQRAQLRRPERFVEAHSHAPSQWIETPVADGLDGPVVIVDDELTTGATAAGLIRTLHRRRPRARYVVAALVDARGPDRGPLHLCAEELGCDIRVVALRRQATPEPGRPGWSAGRLPERRATPIDPAVSVSVADAHIGYEGPLQHHGQPAAARSRLAVLAREAAIALAPLPAGSLVLGTGEHLAFAQHFAAQSGLLTGSSTRSPVLVSQLEGYPITDGLAFASPEGLDVAGYAYNIHAVDRPHIVVHFQDAAHHGRGQALIDALVGAGARAITTVTLAP